MSPEVAPPAVFDAAELAEYIEMLMLVNGSERLSAAEVSSSLPAGQQPTSAQISFAFLELERRRTCGGSAYPYSVQGRNVARIKSAMSPVYDFMLLCSMEHSPMRTVRDFGVADQLFDAVIREASAQIFGRDGRALVFAWPARDGRPKNFSAAVSWVGQQLGIGDGNGERPTDEKDSGVDVIAWRPFPDGRGGFPVYLYQNTLRIDFTLKAREVEPAMWRSWLDFNTFGLHPNVGFATPFALTDADDRWRTIGYSASPILDRLRIAGLVDQRQPFPELSLISEFNAQQLAGIAAGNTGGKVVGAVRRRTKTMAAERRRRKLSEVVRAARTRD